MKDISSLMPDPSLPAIGSRQKIKTSASFWFLWLFLLAMTSSVFLFTLGIAPMLHKDEFTTLELGRAVLHPHTDWSVTWLTAKSQPAFVWFYIGPVIQEASF